jgi:acetyl esterase/lipase
MLSPLCRGLLALTAGLAVGGRVRADSVEEFPLRRGDTAAPSNPEQIVYRTTVLDDHGFNRTIQHVAVPTVTVYRPATTGHRGASLVICPGGGYSQLVIDREDRAMGRYFQAQGIASVVLKYRLPDPAATKEALPWPQQDALEAIRYARRHAAEWGTDPRRVGILGSSAGGHLAGSMGFLGNAADGSRPDFVVLLYPVVSMAPPLAHMGSRLHLLGPDPAPERVAAFSLEQLARPGLPPFLVFHGKADRTVPVENSVQLVAALTKAGDSARLVLFDHAGHGFGLGVDPVTSSWKGEFLRWLDGLP